MKSKNNNNIISILVTVVFIIILFSKYLFSSHSLEFSYNIYEMPLLVLIKNIFSNQFSQLILIVGLILLQSLLLNMAFFNSFVNKVFKNYFPAVLSIFFLIIVMQVDGVLPVYIANLFIIIGINSLVKNINIKKFNDARFFNAAFLFSLASLFYFDAIYLFINLFIFIIFINRRDSFKAFLLTIIGLFVPYFFVGTYLYVTDSLYLIVDPIVNATSRGIDLGMVNYLPFVICLAVVLLLSVAKLSFSRLTVESKRMYVYFSLLLITNILIFFVFSRNTEFIIFIFSMAAVLVSSYFSQIRFFKFVILILFLLAVLYFQYPSIIKFI